MSPYSHGVSVPAGMRLVTTAGQVGITKDGVVPATVEEQLELIWTNTAAILADDGLKLSAASIPPFLRIGHAYHFAERHEAMLYN